MRNPSIQVATIILAGGQGTRLHPLTIHHSKPAVAYGGRYRLIDIPISNSLNSDFREIFVIAQYLSTELQNHIKQTYHFNKAHPGNILVLTPQENENFRGTADAVRKNLPEILKSAADYFLILSGDQLYNINFQQMVSFTQEKGADLSLASIPVFQKDATRMGLLKIDENYLVEDFVEKPKDLDTIRRFILDEAFFKTSHMAPPKETAFLGSMGIYVFKREALIRFLQEDQRDDFGYHLITTAVKAKKTFAFVYHGYWEDIGTVASYYEANLMMTQSDLMGLNTYDESNPIYTRPTFLPGPKIESTKIIQSIICEGSIIEAEEISHSIIGLRSRIRKGTVIRDTVMMGNHIHSDLHKTSHYGIGENCLIEKAIIDEHVRIGDRVKLTNSKKIEHYDGEGIFIRDGIIIVTAGTSLPNDFTL